MVQRALITSVDKDKGSGGNKAKKDIAFFLKKRLNFETFDMAIDGANRIEQFLFINTHLRNYIKKQKPSILVFQYPNLHFYVMNKLVSFYRKYVSNGKIYFIIHDIMGWQFAHNSDILSQEISLFNNVDGLVVHNSYMKSFLINHGVKVKMCQLELFDYNNNLAFAPMSKENSICFPGNLKKSRFLQKLSLKTTIDIYGPHPATHYPKNVHYCGNFPSEKIAGRLKENFGLVWDGDSAKTCTGSVGEYLKINNPHKASLYISTGIPVIVWEKAAIADVVNRFHIGFTVKSLTEIDDRIKEIDQTQYLQMKNNTKKLGEKVRNGDFVCSAVSKLINDEFDND